MVLRSCGVAMEEARGRERERRESGAVASKGRVSSVGAAGDYLVDWSG